MNETDPLRTAEREIRELLQRLNAAWGDADAFAACFTEDAEYITFDGSMVKGRRAIAESHRPLFEGIMRGSRLVSQESAIRLLTPDVALAHGQGAVLKRWQKRPGKRALSVQTTVVIRQDGDWLITAFQNTRYRPWTETLMGRLLVRLNSRASTSATKSQPE